MYIRKLVEQTSVSIHELRGSPEQQSCGVCAVSFAFIFDCDAVGIGIIAVGGSSVCTTPRVV